MSLDERKRSIMSIITDRGEITLTDLSKRLHYSQATLRRDAAALEREGLIRRTHGKLHRVDSISNNVPPVDDRSLINLSAKQRIARRAAGLIGSRGTVILDSGTTTGELAKAIAGRPITVVTNSLEISLSLAHSQTRVISCGGQLEQDHLCFLGSVAEEFFSSIEADALFLGTSGVRGSQGLTTSSPLQFNLKQAMLKAAKKRVVLCDLSKFDTACLFLFSDFSDIDTLVTARPESGSQAETLLREIGQRGVEVLYAEEEGETRC